MTHQTSRLTHGSSTHIGAAERLTPLDLEKERELVDDIADAVDRFACFQHLREQWRLQDEYQYLGPIQFFGDPALTDRVPLTLMLETWRLSAD